jgi:hypothetical protein
MATITLDVPDDLLNEARQRLASYHRSIEDYLTGVLYELTDGEPAWAPLSAQEEELIEEGLRSPLIEVDESFWQRLRERAERFRR